MKTLGGRYVLINSDSKKEIFLEWKMANIHKNGYQTQTQRLPMQYMERKNLISQLQPINLIKNKPIPSSNSGKNIKTSASTNKISPYIYANLERQNPTTTDFNPNRQYHKTLYRSRSLSKGLRNTKQVHLPKKQLDLTQLYGKVKQSLKVNDGKVICIMSMRRSGLRYKLSHKFFIIGKNTIHRQFINQALLQLFPNIQNKPLYLFHLSKQPINDVTRNIDQKELVIFGDLSPKFNLPFEIQMKLFEQASALENAIKKILKQCLQYENEFIQQKEDRAVYGSELRRIKYESEMRNLKRTKQKYEWQKIGNVNDYVNNLINNPEMAKNIRRDITEKDELENWCNQNFIPGQEDDVASDQNPQGSQKNPFFNVQTHYPKQTSDQIGLEATLERMENIQTTKNNHQTHHSALENMMEKIKREKQKFDRLKKQEVDRIKLLGYKSEKNILKFLDNKNTLLVEQNIPYIMEKYGITRAEAYNLYNLFKSLQKISAMRQFNNNEHVIVREKGIDRETFDEGLKALEINPGDEVIRNICYFPDYITWEEFIKIISISLRKTTESKLEAILEGIGSSSVGQLSENQISIMINSSLQKIFGKQQPQLRSHFVNVVMRTMDKNKSGTIQCEELKAHVLRDDNQNMDLISYLILNS